MAITPPTVFRRGGKREEEEEEEEATLSDVRPLAAWRGGGGGSREGFGVFFSLSIFLIGIVTAPFLPPSDRTTYVMSETEKRGKLGCG